MKTEYREEYIIIKPESRFDIIILYWIIKSVGKVGTTIKWQEKIESGLKTKRTLEVVTVIIQYDDIRIDHSIKSLRITGRIIESSKNELVGKRIGIDLNINNTTIVPKDDTAEKILRKTMPKKSILVIILDIDGYVIAEVSDRIEIIDEKYIPTADILEKEEMEIKKDVTNINELVKRYRERGSVVVLGYNIGSKNLAKKIKGVDYKVEKTLSANINGVLTILKEIANEKAIREANELAKAVQIYDELLSKELTKVVYGIKEIIEKIGYGIIHTIIFTDKVIHDKKILDYILQAYLSCINVHFVDSYSSLGRYVNQYGGVIAISY